MMNDHYILDGHTPVKADLMTWARWFESTENRHVANTHIGDVHISTLFLGLDHNFGEGPPLLYKTMIFGGEHDEWQDRCSTWEQAEAMHKAACEMVSATAKLPGEVGMSAIPYIGYGNDTLANMPQVAEGDKIICPRCVGVHALECGTTDGKKTDTIMFYKCGAKTFLGAVKGRLVAGIKPDVSGSAPQ